MDAKVADQPAATLNQELLNHLAKQSRWMALPVFSGAALIAAIAYAATGSVWSFVWLVGVVAVLAIRFVVLGRLPKWKQIGESARLRIAVLLSGLNGIMHGTAVVFFPFLMQFERFVVYVIILAFCAGSVSSTAGYRPVFLAYVLPTLLPLAATWGVNPRAQGSWQDYFVAVLTIFFGGVLIVLARDAFELFRRYIQMNTQLKQSDAAKTRFLAAASHDLRQPVQALTLYSGILKQRRLDETTADIAVHVEKAVDALRVELEQLLNISKLDAGVVRPTLGAYRLQPILNRLSAQFAPLAENKKLDFQVLCPGDPVVETDESSLEQILRNLIGNAIKFTDSGSVTLAIERDGDSYLLTLTDTGRGIAGKDRERVFDEFYQADNPGRDRSQGFGLGLAITKRLFDLLDLDWAMHTNPGQGTTFELRVPVASGPVELDEAVQEPKLPAELHVLVIDDDPEVLKATRLQLEAFGYGVEAVDRALAALTAIGRNEPDLVLCDLRLGGADTGIETIRLLRERIPALPAILMTGDTAPERLSDLDASGLTILHKPFRSETLAAAINKTCGASGDAHPSIEQRSPDQK